MIKTKIVKGEIKPSRDHELVKNNGAELVFNGRVRDSEEGQKIVALEYEHYQDMAEQELRQLAEEVSQKFPIHDLFCQHRVGKIPVGETALHVAIWSEHRVEGLAAMTWFITALKKRVPIWKWAVLPDGTKFPSK